MTPTRWYSTWTPGCMHFDILCMTRDGEDGMDQSKWAIPRARRGVCTKALAKLERPRCKVQGVWAHGCCLCLYPVDVRQSADGSMVVESIAKTLEHCKSLYNAKGREMPRRIFLIAPRLVKAYHYVLRSTTVFARTRIRRCSSGCAICS